MSQTHDEVRALRVMVEVLRAEPPPDLHWDAIEQRLLSRIAAQHARASEGESVPAVSVWERVPRQDRRSATTGRATSWSPRERPTTIGRLIGLAAAAAALALGVGSLVGSGDMPAAASLPRRQIDAATVAFAPGDAHTPGPAVHDLSALRVGDVVEAGDAPVLFGQAGLAVWELAPGSIVHVDSTGVGHTVTLERGAIRAEVTPRDPSEGLVEAFAVEVGGTRVAVHGTAFSVKIEGGQAIVDVEHGAVAVGPVGNVGATTGHLLVGPSRASFSLDGGRSARLLDRADGALVASAFFPVVTESSTPSMAPAAAVALLDPAPVASADAPVAHDADHSAAPAPRQHAGRALADDKAAAHSVAAPPPTPEAPAEPPRLGAATVQARLNRCFRLSYEANRGGLAVDPSFSVNSTLRVDVRVDGTWSARFDPPLRPEVQECAGSVMSGRFPDGAGHLDIPVSFRP